MLEPPDLVAEGRPDARRLAFEEGRPGRVVVDQLDVADQQRQGSQS